MASCLHFVQQPSAACGLDLCISPSQLSRLSASDQGPELHSIRFTTRDRDPLSRFIHRTKRDRPCRPSFQSLLSPFWTDRPRCLPCSTWPSSIRIRKYRTCPHTVHLSPFLPDLSLS